MDLPTCPSCGQSVIDDDAEVCPFCGSSMSAKPGRESKVAPQAAAAPVATKPAKATEKPAEDDPFATDPNAHKAQARCLSRPRKGCTYRVVCPMCETQGFIPSSAAGQDVRCANPDCLVPVFTAPRPDGAPAAPAPPKRKRPTPATLGGLVVLLMAVGGGLYYGFYAPDPTAQISAPAVIQRDKGQAALVKPTDGTSNPLKDPLTANTAQTTNTAAGATTPGGMQQWVLERMVETARLTSQNRSKPICRRMTALSYARSGNIAEARKQLEQLKVVGPKLDFYQIGPLVEIAWQQLASGQRPAAEATLDEALALITELPKFGRESLDVTINLAAALAAVDRLDQAAKAAAFPTGTPAALPIASELQIALATREFDLSHADDFVVTGGWADPRGPAIAIVTAARGFSPQSLAWAGQLTGARAHAEAVAAWAEAVLTHQTAATDPQLQAAVASVATPAGRVLVQSRIASRYVRQNKAVAAKTWLTAAEKELSELAVPESLDLGTMQSIYEANSLPDTANLRQAAIAAAEVARVHASLGEATPAWERVQLALRFARAISPSVSAVTRRLAEADRAGLDSMRLQLKDLLKLKSLDEARLAYNQYHRNLRRMHEAADVQLRLQMTILAGAAEWGLAEQAWKELLDRARAASPDQREPFLTTELPYQIQRAALQSQNTALVRSIEEALGPANPSNQNPSAAPLVSMELAAVRDALAKRDAVEAASLFDRAKIPNDDRSGWAMRLAGEQIAAGNVREGLTFIDHVSSDLIREDAFEVAVAQAVHSGQLQSAWDFVKAANQAPTVRISAYLGMVTGINSLPTSTASPAAGAGE